MKYVHTIQQWGIQIFLLIAIFFVTSVSFADFTPQYPATDDRYIPHSSGITRGVNGEAENCKYSDQGGTGTVCPDGLNIPSFNNFTDSGGGEGINDERRFFVAKNFTQGSAFTNVISVSHGDEIQLQGYIHNNGYLDDPNVTATGVTLKTLGLNRVGDGIYATQASTSITLRQEVSASNANTISDDLTITSANGKKIELFYVHNNNYIRTVAADNSRPRNDTIIPGDGEGNGFFEANGSNIGNVRGCVANSLFTDFTLYVREIPEDPINGKCNTDVNARNFSATETDYTRTNAGFCTQGTAQQISGGVTRNYTNILFPNTTNGSPQSWQCLGENNGSTATCTATQTPVVTPDPDVVIEKYVEGLQEGTYQALQGSRVNYELRYWNVSDTTAENITVVDTFPNEYLQNIVIDTNALPAGMTCSVSNERGLIPLPDPDALLAAPGKIVCSGQQTLNSGSSTDYQSIRFSAEVIANTPENTLVRNNAQVDATNEPASKKTYLDAELDNSSFANVRVTADPGPACGTNASAAYPATGVTDYPSRLSSAFCANGTPNPYSLSNPYAPVFPDPGQTVTWQCEIAGKTPVTCSATRAAELIPNVTIEKTVDKSVVNPGDTVTYTVKYRNTVVGSTAINASFRDTHVGAPTFSQYFESFSVVKGASTCIPGLDPLSSILSTCPLGNLPYSADWYDEVVYTGKIAADVPRGTVITNTVVIDADNEPNTIQYTQDNTDNAVITIPVQTSYDLEIDKLVNSNTTGVSVAPNSEVTFTVTYRNRPESTQSADNVQLVDTYDSSKLAIIAASLPAGCSDNTVGTITCTIGSLAPGNGTTLTYKANLQAGFTTGSTINKVEITSPTPNNTDLTNDTDEVTITVTPDPTPLCGGNTNNGNKYPAVMNPENYPSRNKTDFCSVGDVYYNNTLVTDYSTLPPFPAVGATIQWNCRVNNNIDTQSTCQATRLPENTDDLSCTLRLNPTAINKGGTATLSWTTTGSTTRTINQGIGSVPVTGTRTVAPSDDTTYILTVSDGTETKQCTAALDVLHSAPPGGGGGGGGGGACNVDGTIDLNIAKYIKVGNGAFVPASSENIAANLESGTNSVVYKIVVSNAGSASAYNTKVKDIFASANGFSQRNISNVSGAQFNPATNVFTFSYLIPANGSKEFVYSAIINAVEGGIGKNTARIESFTTPYSCPYITSEKGIGRSATTYVKAGEMLEAKYFLDKRVNKSEVKAGETLFYTLILKNRGDVTMENVVLYDRFPSEYLEVLDKSNLTNNRTLQFSRHLLHPNEEFRVKVKMKVREGVPEGTKMVNVLTASSDNVEINMSDEEVVKVTETPVQTPTCPGGYNYDESKKMCKLVNSGLDIPALPIGAVLLGLAMVWRRDDISQMFA